MVELIKEFPLSDIGGQMMEEKIRKVAYTKQEVNIMIDRAVKVAVEEARRIDAESMRKHNRDATVISMILGFTALALFVDGLLRLLGIIPPFMQIDIDVLDKIVERVENDVIDKVRQVPIQKILQSGFRWMVLIFVVCWVITLVYAVRLMYSLYSTTDYGVIEGKKVIRKIPHPEMMEVKPGDELMVVKFGDEEPKDELHEELKNRIEELEDDDEDDDGEGDVVISRR